MIAFSHVGIAYFFCMPRNAPLKRFDSHSHRCHFLVMQSTLRVCIVLAYWYVSTCLGHLNDPHVIGMELVVLFPSNVTFLPCESQLFETSFNYPVNELQMSFTNHASQILQCHLPTLWANYKFHMYTYSSSYRFLRWSCLAPIACLGDYQSFAIGSLYSRTLRWFLMPFSSW